MNRVIEPIYTFFERQAFGVCAWWAEKLNIESASIRLFFIYSSFLALGSPLILYLAMALVLKVRNSFRKKRNTVWDL